MKTKYNSTLSAAEAKGGDQTLNKTIRRRGVGVGPVGLLAVLVLFLLPSLVEAQECLRWSVSGQWSFKQSNQGALNQMDLRQDGTDITGTASYATGKGGVMRGSVDGYFYAHVPNNPQGFQIEIFWENGWIGVYRGWIKDRGRIEGDGWERRTPKTKVTWFSNRVMKCLERA